MEKQIGIVVCNFNKEKYIVNCVKSIMNQTINNFDVYVVDNASSDNSVNALKEEFGNTISVLVNKENLGGAGGFDTGLRVALQRDYKYLMLMDNDVVINEDAIEELYKYMESHEDVGLCGAKIYSMDYPNKIMAFGSIVDMNKFEYKDCYAWEEDSKDFPEVNFCDYVPACTLMVRRKVVDQVGIMDERNFIYWDDIDWAKRITMAGYKVCAINKAKVYHKGGGRGAQNTFPIYHYIRNNIKYFGSYLDEEMYDAYADAILTYIYQRIHGSFSKGRLTYIDSVMKAYYDGIYCTYGKAGEGRIVPIVDENNKAYELIGKSQNVVLHICPEILEKENGTFDRLLCPIENKKARGEWADINFYLEPGNCVVDILRQKIRDKKIDIYVQETNSSELHLQVCNNIRELKAYEQGELYIDSSYNAVFDEEDFVYHSSYERGLKLFVSCHKEYLMERLPYIKENTKQYWEAQK